MVNSKGRATEFEGSINVAPEEVDARREMVLALGEAHPYHGQSICT
jgi:hypothetical protein